MMSSWRCTALCISARWRSQRSVEPSMSENKKVTVPLGRGLRSATASDTIRLRPAVGFEPHVRHVHVWHVFREDPVRMCFGPILREHGEKLEVLVLLGAAATPQDRDDRRKQLPILIDEPGEMVEKDVGIHDLVFHERA